MGCLPGKHLNVNRFFVFSFACLDFWPANLVPAPQFHESGVARNGFRGK
jgi:hypothetical protein